MFKGTATHIVTVAERVYILTCDNNSPFAELLDVLAMITKNVQKLKDDAEQAAKSKEESSEVKE